MGSIILVLQRKYGLEQSKPVLLMIAIKFWRLPTTRQRQFQLWMGTITTNCFVNWE